MNQENAYSNSLEAKHLIWVWIMKVKGPKNQADFIEVLYMQSLKVFYLLIPKALDAATP